MTKSSSIQALYDLCKKTFTPSGTAAASQAIQKLCSFLDTIGPDDAGLKEENAESDQGHGFFGTNQLNRVARWAQHITYLDIHECDSFTASYISLLLCIFCLPTSSIIPLHDHPGMTVLSKVLYGSMHVRAYDWVEPAYIQKSRGPVRLAKLALDKVLPATCGSSVLYPKSGGNMHCFTAVTPCEMLGILAPPYLEAVGRKCTYYRDHPCSCFRNVPDEVPSGREEKYAWLEEIDTPDDLYMSRG